MTAAVIIGAAEVRHSHVALTNDLQQLSDRLRRSTVRIHTRGVRLDGVGAGVLWTHGPESLVVTNAHVVPPGRGNEAVVEDHRGRMSAARVVARHRDHDLALLKLADSADWPEPIALADDRALRVGELVAAVGHPFGVAGALSLGIVHAVPNDDHSWIRADVRLSPGNSGGPLAALDGTVLGINAMIVRGLGIAVPARAVRAFVAHAAESVDADS